MKRTVVPFILYHLLDLLALLCLLGLAAALGGCQSATPQPAATTALATDTPASTAVPVAPPSPTPAPPASATAAATSVAATPGATPIPANTMAATPVNTVAPTPANTLAPATSTATPSPAPTATLAPPTNTPVPPTPSAAAGAAAWKTLPCSGCHGGQAQGALGPRIAGTALSFDAVYLQVRAGKGIMPAFTPQQVSDQQIRDVYAWLRSLAPPTPTPIVRSAYPLGNLLAFEGAVTEVKVRSDFAKDLPTRLAPNDPAGQLNILKQYVAQALDLIAQARPRGNAALSEIAEPAVQAAIRGSLAGLDQIAAAGNAALGSDTFAAAWTHAHEMVKVSRVEAWPLSIQAVRQAGSIGSVRTRVTDQAGRPLAGALVMVLTAQQPAAGLTDASGQVTLRNIAAVPDTLVKVFYPGSIYHEVHIDVSAGATLDVTVAIPGRNVAGQAPSVSNASITPASGPGNATVTLAMTATDPQGKLGLAVEQIFAMGPRLELAVILGNAGGDRYQASLSLPNLARGSYTFYMFAVDNECNTSNWIPLTYTVP